jgi:aminopeptidase N
VIPFAVGLVSADGIDLPSRAAPGDAPLRVELETNGSKTAILPFTEREQSFVFTASTSAPVPSLLRGFSAPVHVRFDYSMATSST